MSIIKCIQRIILYTLDRMLVTGKTIEIKNIGPWLLVNV